MQSNESIKPLPAIFIGEEILKTKVDKFLNEKYTLLSNAQKEKDINREETKSIWYSREHVQTWLDEMNLLNADGMRVHFGAYGDSEGIAPGQLCLLMTLTRTSEQGLPGEDIIYENLPDFEARKNASVNSRSFNESKDLDFDSKPKEFNYGSPCPPICR